MMFTPFRVMGLLKFFPFNTIHKMVAKVEIMLMQRSFERLRELNPNDPSHGIMIICKKRVASGIF